ncbi:MAG TPA: hypothetical protein VGZ47_19975 [Gemmataceae bacterium]|nr:hypothetical protein [Gemmataceae bacterium]
MADKKITCPQCGAALILDGEFGAAEKARCPDCKAIFGVPRHPPPREPAPPPRPARRPARPRRSYYGTGMPGTWIVVGAVTLVVLIAAGVVGMIVLRGKGGPAPLSAGGMFSPDGLGINPLVSKANFDRLEPCMTLDEVQSILGPGTPATEDDIKKACTVVRQFGGPPRLPDSDPAGDWINNGRVAHVTGWYQWRAADLTVFVGFAKGKTTGKIRALLSFWFQRFGANGYATAPGFAEFDDPDKVTVKLDAEKRLFNDSKWKKGNARQLLLGRWHIAGRLQDQAKIGYEFGADGTVKSFGGLNYSGTYRFIDDDHIEIKAPATQLLPASVEKYRVLVSQDELVVIVHEGRRPVFDRYVRAK